MSALFDIMDKTIGFVYKNAAQIGGIAGVSFYFTRKTTDTNLPIEVSFIRYSGKIHAISKQLNGGYLEEATIDGSEVYMYANDIVFHKSEIELVLDSTDDTVNEHSIVSSILSLFGIDLSGIENIEGFEFDKMLYLDELKAEGVYDYFRGNMLIFHDVATKTMKMGIYAGELIPYTMAEYRDELNAYGRSRIMSEVSVENKQNTTVIKNESDFRVKLKVNKYTYDIKRAVYADKNFERRDVDSFSVSLDPNQEYTLIHEKRQRAQSYTMLYTKDKAPEGPIFISDSESYLAAKEYIDEEPFDIELTDVMSFVGVTDPDRYVTVSAFHDIQKDGEHFKKAILDKEDSLQGVEVVGDFGGLTVSDTETLLDFVSGKTGTSFASRMKVLFKYTTVCTDIDSCTPVVKSKQWIDGWYSRGYWAYTYYTPSEKESHFDSVIDYTLGSTDYRVLSMQSRVVYNDTISTPQQAFVVTIGLVGNVNEIMNKSGNLKYSETIAGDKLPCKKDQDSIVSKLIGSELFSSDYVSTGILDVLDNATKKVYRGPAYKTFNGEIDDAYAMYQDTLDMELGGFNLVNFDQTISSADFASVEPEFNYTKESECRENFKTNAQDQIDELGLEISLGAAIKKMKQVAYVYRQPDEIVATVTLGYTLDGEWYFCGEDFFPASTVDNNEFTTFLDNDIVSLNRESTDGYRPVYDKKIFFDQNDWAAESLSMMKDAFQTVIFGKSGSTINDNPGMKYIAEHLLDSQRKLSFSHKEMMLDSKYALYSKNVEKVQNTMLMPNLFMRLVEEGKQNLSVVDKYLEYAAEPKAISREDKNYFGKARDLIRAEGSNIIDNYGGSRSAVSGAFNIGHTVDVMMNTEAMKAGAMLFGDYGKVLFGVDTGEFTLVDTLSIKKRTNVIIGDNRYAFSVTITKNEVDAFTIAYDYKTKNLTIDNIAGFKIVSYPLLIATFDILLHDYYNTLEGLDRTALGVYDYFGGSGDAMSEQYLLINAKPPESTNYRLLSIVANFRDTQFVITEDGTQTKVLGTSLRYDSNIEASVTLDDKTLETSSGVDTITFNRQLLENAPSSTIQKGGVSLELYRTKKTLPARFFGQSLRFATVTLVDASRSTELSEDDEGILTTVPFSYAKEFSTNGPYSYMFAFGGDGLQCWKTSDKFTAKPVLIMSIDSIMSDISADTETTIDDIVFSVSFE